MLSNPLHSNSRYEMHSAPLCGSSKQIFHTPPHRRSSSFASSSYKKAGPVRNARKRLKYVAGKLFHQLRNKGVRQERSNRTFVAPRHATPFRAKKASGYDKKRVAQIIDRLQSGLTIQIAVVPDNKVHSTFCAFFDTHTYIAKLCEVDNNEFVLETWRPLTGDVVNNLLDNVEDLFYDDEINAIYILGTCKGDIVVRCTDDTTTYQLCIVLRKCILGNLKSPSKGPSHTHEHEINDCDKNVESDVSYVNIGVFKLYSAFLLCIAVLSLFLNNFIPSESM